MLKIPHCPTQISQTRQVGQQRDKEVVICGELGEALKLRMHLEPGTEMNGIGSKQQPKKIGLIVRVFPLVIAINYKKKTSGSTPAQPAICCELESGHTSHEETKLCSR